MPPLLPCGQTQPTRAAYQRHTIQSTPSVLLHAWLQLACVQQQKPALHEATSAALTGLGPKRAVNETPGLAHTHCVAHGAAASTTSSEAPWLLAALRCTLQHAMRRRTAVVL